MDTLRRLKQFRQGKKVIQVHSVDSVYLTHGLAKKFKNMAAWKGERNLNFARIAYLLESIPIIHLPFMWITVHVKALGMLYRLNGQHTSHIFAERPKLIAPEMRVLVIHYECADLTEVAVLYASLDSRMSTRTSADVNRSLSGGHPRLEVLPDALINVCASGLRMSIRDVLDHKNLTVIDSGELIYHNIDFIVDFAAELLPSRGEDYKHLWRAPVLFAIHQTYRVDPEAAKEFWTVVRDGSSLKKHVVPNVLRDYLRATALGGTTVRSTRVNSRFEMAGKQINMWNIWRKNSRRLLKRPPFDHGKEFPKPI